MTADALALDAPPLTAKGTRRARENQPMNELRFEAFYRQTAGGLWSYLYRLTGDSAAADDLVQKSFLRFVRADPNIEDDEHLRRYLYRTATNLALDHFRETKRRRERDAELANSARPRDSRGELRHDMQRIFGELKPRERALLWLAHVEESNHDEIAEALELKPKSVRVLLFRARRKLKDLLTKKGLAPERER